ncbi:MAG: chain length-determining protein [Gammaproteobacteria bacterium]|nr:chain length-determining protein [Gammaproteobacteria bacterium]
MQEILNQLYGYLRGIWRRRWPMLAAAWFVCIIGWLVVLRLPDQYEASARVYLDTQSVLRPLLRGLVVQGNVEQQVNMITKTLLSRPNLEKVARMTDLDITAKTPEETETLLDSLAGRMKFDAGGRDNLYIITFRDSNPELAKRVVQSLLTIFVEGSLGTTRSDTDVAQKFIDQQIEEYEKRLTEAEDKLKQFKQANVGKMPTDNAGYYSRLQSEMTSAQQAELELREATNRRDRLKEQLADEQEAVAGDLQNNVMPQASPVDARIQGLQAKLDELLLQYTDRHPDVLSIKSTIADLKKQKEGQAGAAVRSGLSVNPVYQQLKISLGEAEANVASLKARVGEYRSRVGQLKGMVNTVPQVEAEMARLNRDYEVVKQSYDELLQRRESAHMAEGAEQTGGDVKFRVIDPPRVPLEPAGPNRILFLSVVTLAGVVMGVALGFLLSQIHATFDTRAALREATGLPVLGSISMEWTPAQRMKLRMETMLFMGASAALVLSYLLALVLQGPVSSLMVKIL